MADKRLKDEKDLRPDRLLPEYLQQVKASMQATDKKLSYGDTSFDIYEKGRYLVAVEHRRKEDRYSFYIGNDVDDLKERTARDLVRRNLISSPGALKIV